MNAPVVFSELLIWMFTQSKNFDGAYTQLREKETPAEQLIALKDKVEPIIRMLEEAESSDALAVKLLELV